LGNRGTAGLLQGCLTIQHEISEGDRFFEVNDV
jgi:hypothetical protein